MEQMRNKPAVPLVRRADHRSAARDYLAFSKNRDRPLEREVVEAFFTGVMRLANKQGPLSREHSSVDGTTIQAWTSHKSFRPKHGSDDPPTGGGRNVDTDRKGKRRRNNA